MEDAMEFGGIQAGQPDRSRFENNLVLFARILHGYLAGRMSLSETGAYQRVVKAAADACGIFAGEGFWWMTDIERAKEYAARNLSYDVEQRVGDWQILGRAENIQNLQGMSENAVVYISRGHFSSFRNTTVSQTSEFSPYSREARSKMEKEFRSAQNDRDWDTFSAIPDSARVQSESGAVYSSVTDYLYSAEHQSDRARELSDFKDSLVSRSKVNTTYAFSSSSDFSMTHLLAQYTQAGGTLTAVAFVDFRLIDQEGQVPDGFQGIRFDPLVVTADCIEKDRSVLRVSPALFTGTYEPLPSADLACSVMASFMVFGNKAMFL